MAKTGTAAVVNSGTVAYAYDEAGHLLGEYTASGLAIQETIYLDDAPVGVLFGAGDATGTGGDGGGCVGRGCPPNPHPGPVTNYTTNQFGPPCTPDDTNNCGGGGGDPTPTPASYIGITYAYADQTNTSRVLIRPEDNNMMWRWDGADPFGATLPNENPSNLASSLSYNLRFPGQVYDRESNLNYNYFRNYDPSVGRYVQSDPTGLRSGMNTYAYANLHPNDIYDADGRQPAGRSVYYPRGPAPSGPPSMSQNSGVGTTGSIMSEFTNMPLLELAPLI